MKPTKEQLTEIIGMCDIYFPYDSYKDNKAACILAERINRIKEKLLEILALYPERPVVDQFAFLNGQYPDEFIKYVKEHFDCYNGMFYQDKDGGYYEFTPQYVFRYWQQNINKSEK